MLARLKSMNAMRPQLLAALLVLSSNAIAAAQPADAAAYQRARASLPGANATAFESIVASARTRGLPVEPLIDKVLEGAAKRVPPDRIVAVVRARADQLGRAQALSGIRGGAEIVVVADALQRGVPEHAVTQMRGAAKPNEPFGLALHTYADLVQAGVPAEVALEVLAGWRARGGRGNELRELPTAVERLIREGVPPGRAGGAVAAALKSGNAAASATIDGVVGRGNARGTIKLDKPLVNPKGTPPGQ